MSGVLSTNSENDLHLVIGDYFSAEDSSSTSLRIATESSCWLYLGSITNADSISSDSLKGETLAS